MESNQAKMPVSFDTLAASKRLRKSGMPMNQADATTGVVAAASRLSPKSCACEMLAPR